GGRSPRAAIRHSVRTLTDRRSATSRAVSRSFVGIRIGRSADMAASGRTAKTKRAGSVRNVRNYTTCSQSELQGKKAGGGRSRRPAPIDVPEKTPAAARDEC